MASLLSEDPGDFHLERARIWRIGSARWVSTGPELPGRPNEQLRDSTLGHPIEVVVVDPEGPRVLLPLDQLAPARELDAAWSALRMVAVLSPGDLVVGLRRELHPTAWLTLAAGVGLTPLGREDDHLRVNWSDPACGFGLELALDTENFGPRYEPGPSGPPDDLPDPPDHIARRLVAGTTIYASAEAQEALISLDTQVQSPGERMSVAQRVELVGKPKRGRQEMTLRCRGVEISGWVASNAIEENPSRYSLAQAPSLPNSACTELGEDRISLPEATPLYEPGDETALIGVSANEVDVVAQPGTDGWWMGCVPSPWGDLVFQFQLR